MVTEQSPSPLPTPDAPPPADRYIDKFLRYLDIERNASPHTLLNYRLDLIHCRTFLQQPWDEVNHLSIRRYLAQLKQAALAKRTVARHLAALRSFFRFLCREGLLKDNPAVAVSTPKLERRLPSAEASSDNGEESVADV